MSIITDRTQEAVDRANAARMDSYLTMAAVVPVLREQLRVLVRQIEQLRLAIDQKETERDFISPEDTATRKAIEQDGRAAWLQAGNTLDYPVEVTLDRVQRAMAIIKDSYRKLQRNDSIMEAIYDMADEIEDIEPILPLSLEEFV